MNSPMEAIVAIFRRKFHHGERATSSGGAMPKEFRLANPRLGITELSPCWSDVRVTIAPLAGVP